MQRTQSNMSTKGTSAFSEARRAQWRAYFQRRKAQRRDYALRYLGGRCCHCGHEYTGRNAQDFEFDHLRDKVAAITNALTWRLSRLLEELNKCQLLCVRCHYVKTWGHPPRRVVRRKRQPGLRQVGGVWYDANDNPVYDDDEGGTQAWSG
jgi:hypothetical protein